MPIDSALGPAGLKPGICTSTTRPTNPYIGQVIFETDSLLVFFWDGAWKSLATSATVTALDAGLNARYVAVPTAWVAITAFTNSWVAGGSVPRYRKIGDQVYVDGVVTGGALISSAFTLPVGFRPSRALQMQCAANNGNTSTMLILDTGGLVQPWVGSNVSVNLNFNFSTV